MSPTDTRTQASERLEHSWSTNRRWHGIERRYSADEVVGLRGSVEIEHSLARPRRREPLAPLDESAMSLRWARSPAARRCRW